MSSSEHYGGSYPPPGAPGGYNSYPGGPPPPGAGGPGGPPPPTSAADGRPPSHPGNLCLCDIYLGSYRGIYFYTNGKIIVTTSCINSKQNLKIL